MFAQVVHFAKGLLDRLAYAAHQLFRRVTRPALSNPFTGTLADLPRNRAQLLAENALLRQQLAVLHTCPARKCGSPGEDPTPGLE